jgi:hypothetical protein
VSAEEDGTADRSEKATCRPSDMHAFGKSDDCVVPELSANCNDGISAVAGVGEFRQGQARTGHCAGQGKTIN